MIFEKSVAEKIELMTGIVRPVETERAALADAPMRVLAEALVAKEDVPPFRRSPLDGYALRSIDTENASKENPVTLSVTEEIAAGEVPTREITQGHAARIMTGAPVPEGADCVIMYEKTEFTDTEVRIFQPLRENENIVQPGEDTRKGEVLAEAGTIIDSGLAGTLAGQNVPQPLVYKVPSVGIIATGSELLEPGEALTPGKIYDSNGQTFNGILKKLGCRPVSYGIAGDDPETIAGKIRTALMECDAVILTGGVSVGDFDYTPLAMEKAGVNILFRGVQLKPGMACAYGEKDHKMVCGLSGNPVSSIINFLVIAMPAFKKLTGRRDYAHEEISVTVKSRFGKASRGTRLIHGKLDLSDGTVRMDLAEKQGNGILSSSIGSDVLAVIPAGSGPLEPGTTLSAIRI